jgi:hypothetical protein
VARRKRKEDEPEWTPPDFDDVGYMRKEIEGAKVAIVTILWAFVGAAVAVLLYDYVHPAVGFVLGLMTFGVLYFLLPLLGLPVAEFKRRDWISHGTIYFFSWIAFWIILLNPPFADHTPPTISSIDVSSFAATNATLPPANSTTCVSASPDSSASVSPGSNKSLLVTFRATDNVKVARVNVSVLGSAVTTYPTVTWVAGAPNACKGQASTYAPGTYAVTFTFSAFPIHVQMTAWDFAGLSTTAGLDIVQGP